MNQERWGALDALRGLAIAGMLLSGLVPYRVLPAWMYHAQNPPPLHAFRPDLPGITWVDLVFPLFLFALGAALPLALGRIASGWDAARGVLRRAAMLALFAIYARHISPHVVELGLPWHDALYALAGLALLFPLLARLPQGWPPAWRIAARCVGWGGAIVLMLLFRDSKGAGFSFMRSDIILMVLANVSLTGGLLWLATRERPSWRLGVLCFLLALRLCKDIPGWGQALWAWSPLPGIFSIPFQQYLFIVVPGMFAGEIVRSHRFARPARPLALAACCLAILAVCLAGLHARQLGATVLLTLVFGAGAWALAGRGGMLDKLLRYGGFLLLLGLALDPYEGGIQKGVATLSYYFVGAGLGFLLLVALLCVGKDLGVVGGAGQNPLFAYTAVHTLLTPILVLTGLGPLIGEWTTQPALGVVRALIYTGLLCWISALLARRGAVLRV